MFNTQLKRTSGDRMIAGVCGGLARYFNIDPAIVRLLFVLAVFAGGVSPLIYVVLWIIMPLDVPTAAATPTPALPYHPRPAEEWKYDPYTGEKIER
ncbi:MAG TPA: PspC domain-containing protein [Roseiflexaceae bacterium]|nr:PspC domain-containing protein [Roseiflexaceae bacterium]